MLKICLAVCSLCFVMGAANADVSSVTYVDTKVDTLSKDLDEYKAANDKTVAAKADVDDPKFNAIPTSKPTGPAPDGYVHIWIE